MLNRREAMLSIAGSLAIPSTAASSGRVREQQNVRPPAHSEGTTLKIEAKLKRMGLELPAAMKVPPGFHVKWKQVRVFGTRAVIAAAAPGAMGVRDPEGGPGESDALERPRRKRGLDRERSRKRSAAARLWAAGVERGQEPEQLDRRRSAHVYDGAASGRVALQDALLADD